MKKTLALLAVLAAACGSDATSDLVSSTKDVDVGPNGLQLSPGGAVQLAAPGVPAVSARTGLMPGEIPWRDPSKPNPDASGCAGAKLLYYGGPVLQNVKIYMVNWGTNVDSTITATMPQFYAAVSNSAYLDWLSEYNTAGLNGKDGQPGTNQGISRGSFAGSVTINPTVCSGTTAGCKLTDAQIQTELNAQIAAGVLPAPTTGCDGLPNTIYMVNFIAAISVRDPNGTRSCVAGGFCAYHGTATSNGTNYAYGVIPSMLTGGCATGCGTSAAKINNETAVSSHELVEAITDTNVGFATVVGRPLAWYDSNCGEIGDICNGQQQTITISGTTWTVQQEWSNAANDCIVSKASLPSLCTDANTPPGCRSCTCADDGEPAGCTGSLPWCETRTGNIKQGYCVQCVADNECPSGDSCPATSSAATDDVCAACGATGQACCSGNTCDAGSVCSGGSCVACGAPNQACCSGSTCNTGDVCNAGTCCVPITTCPSGANCGTVSNGCGGTVSCGGPCTSPQSCGGGGTANQCGCTPTVTMCPPGSDCGMIPNGCGGFVVCGGACTSPQSCGGGGVMNQCGCTPTVTSCPAGADCGTVPDGCGGTVTCGPACTSPQSCGGGGTANQCGCTMTTCAAQSADCGTIPDGCGGTLTCPTCASGTMCVANMCVANPPDLAMPPADLSMIPPPDLAAAPNDLAVGGADDLAANPPPDLAMGNGGKGGCGCRVGGESGPTPPLTSLAVALVLGLGLLRRRLRIR